MQQSKNSNRVREADTFLQNGRNPKSQTSRENIVRTV